MEDILKLPITITDGILYINKPRSHFTYEQMLFLFNHYPTVESICFNYSRKLYKRKDIENELNNK